MKKCLCLTLMVCIFFALGFSAYSLEFQMISVDLTEKCVSVDVSGVPEDDVSLEVLAPNILISSEKPYLPGALSQSLTYIGQKRIGHDGKVNFAIYPIHKSGTYTIRMTGDDGEIVSAQFNFIDSQEVSEIIDLINKNDSIGEYVDFFSIVLETSIYTDVRNKNTIYEYMNQKKPFNDSNPNEFIHHLKTACTLAGIKDAQDNTDIDRILNLNGNESMIVANSSVSTLYDELEDKSDIYERMLGMEVYTYEDTVKSFNNFVLLAYIDYLESWKATEAFIGNFKSDIGITDEKWNEYLTNFANQGRGYEVLGGISGIWYATLDDFVSDFNISLSKAIKGKSNSSQSGGGGPYKVSVEPVNHADSSLIQQPEQNTFQDIDGFEWAKQAIAELKNRYVISGDGSGNFYPDKNVTRKEFVKMLTGAFGLIDNGASSGFIDVPVEDWGYRYVSSAVKREIAYGISEDKFGADDYITRQDMAVMTYRACMLMNIHLEKNYDISFLDENHISAYALEACRAMSEAGIINGIGDRSFAPLANATRAQSAKIIWESLKLLNHNREGI